MSTAVLISAYKRPEYTEKCIKALESSQSYRDVIFYLVDDGSRDGTYEIFKNSTLPKILKKHSEPLGLRNSIIEFFDYVNEEKPQFILKLDNDCVVPDNYVSNMVHALETLPVDILSPNVIPSNAAFKYGKESELGYRTSKSVGGLWVMRSKLVEDISFMTHRTDGIRGAFHLLNQIIVEKEPRIGWLPTVTVEDIGHWSGEHPEHIKSDEHEAYSVEVGRRIAW